MNSKWFFQIRGRPSRRMAALLGALPIAVLILAWFVVTSERDGDAGTRIVSVSILPSPAETLRALPDLLSRKVPMPQSRTQAEAPEKVQYMDNPRYIVAQVWPSLRRVGYGFGLALLITVPLGILMGTFGSARAMFSPLTTASGYIPIAAIAPLTLAWFGVNETQKVSFLAIAFGIALLPQIANAIETVPDVYLRTAYTMGVSRAQMVFRVLIPIALPDIWRSMRVAFGVGWTYLVLAEVIGMERGLGAFIEMSRRRGHPEDVYCTILIITLIAWVADLAWGQAGDWLFPYRRSRT